jgi:hypothetical protein
MTDIVTKPRTTVRPKTERPRLHKVILLNDDYTPREFVVTVLKAEFHMTESQAYKGNHPLKAAGMIGCVCIPGASPAGVPSRQG